MPWGLPRVWFLSWKDGSRLEEDLRSHPALPRNSIDGPMESEVLMVTLWILSVLLNIILFVANRKLLKHLFGPEDD